MELAEIAATLRSYVSKSGTLEAVAMVADDVVVRCDGGGRVTVERGEAEAEPVDHAGATPAELGMELKRLPPFDVDAVKGEVSGPLGGLEHMALGVRALARALGERTVALAWLETLDEETALAISAREGEGVVVVIGDEQFQMDEGWPPERPASDPPVV
jgi:hypothetical protein